MASKKQNAVIRLGMHDRAALQVMWDGVTIVDEITKAKTGEVAITAILLVATKIPPGGFVLQAGNAARVMPLRVVAGPGCDALKESYVEDEMQPGDVVISVGKIFEAITTTTDVPSSNPPALRMALYLRTTAIRLAREKQLNGFILTSNGNRADLDRLVAEAGADGVTIIKLTEAQACARVAQLVPAGSRRLACEEGSSGAGLKGSNRRQPTAR